jgi:FMN phosphatase YigB (HAD superfamily)
MIHALLLDLDDTLLENNVDRFLPAYLQRLGTYMNDLVPAERFIPLLLQATRVMAENIDPERTLERAFAATFYPSLGVSEDSLRPRIDSFYETEFPRLRSLTRPFAEAPRVVRQARERGFDLAIATNPLFPRTAIEQRLDWAGVPVSQNTYELITSYDAVHFAKPFPAYYAEALALLGRPPREAVMAGDNVDADLAPASLLGIPVFHVASVADGPFPGGGLGDILPWIEGQPSTDEAPTPRSPQALTATLRGDLAAMITLAGRLQHDAWYARRPPNDWSPVETLCHLRDAEIEVNLPRLEMILTRPDPFLSAADTDPWVREREYQRQSPVEALAAFTQARKRLLSKLDPLNEGDWSLPARHALLGPTTLLEIIALIVDHERIHLASLRHAALGKPPSSAL